MPTSASPTRQTFVLIRWASGIGGIVPFASDYLKGPPGGHPGGTFLSEPLFATAMRLDRRLILAPDLVDPGAAISVAKAVHRGVDAIKVGWALFLSGERGVFRDLARLGYLLPDLRTAAIPPTPRLILGRAIYEAAEPVAAAKGIAGEIRSAAPR